MDKIDQVIDHYRVEFEPMGRRGPCPAGETILACAQRLGVELTATCGGMGKCKSCKVQIMDGKVSAPTLAEQKAFSEKDLGNGWRLACQTYPKSDCMLSVPRESMTSGQRIQVEGKDKAIDIELPVRSYDVELNPPSLDDPRTDAENLVEKIEQSSSSRCEPIDIGVLQELSSDLRAWSWRCRAYVRNGEIVSIRPINTRTLGLAVDLGSTKIAGYLVDLENGKTLAAKGIMNPQISYGEDVISRINYAIKFPTGLQKMQEVVAEALNMMVDDLCDEVGLTKKDIIEAVIVGNTAMHHLLLHIPVRQLAYSPFVPTIREGMDIKARDIGLDIAPGAYIHILPNVAGYVGADHIAMLIATAGEWDYDNNVLALDIGTNTEISLIIKGEITTVSCASGPAFEGYQIKDGVRATKGAIERIIITGDKVRYQTIDAAQPIGICGSGIIDTVAQLFLSGALNRSGRMKMDSHPRIRRNGRKTEFVLVTEEEGEGNPAITFSQKDVREIQLGKAAIQAGIQILVEESNISMREIDKVIIAGAFGSYIDISNSIAIGMFPPLPLGRFRQVGNAAGVGAKLALLSMIKRAEAQDLYSRVKYLELASHPLFAKAFSQACYLEPYQSMDF